MAKESSVSGLRAILYGLLAALLLGLVFCGLGGFLLDKEVLRPGAVVPASWGIGLFCGLMGGMTASQKAGHQKILYAVVTALLFLLVLFILRGILFKTVAESPWGVPIASVIGSILGAMLGSKSGKRRRK